MPLFDFPFRYGSVPDVPSATTVPVTPARWTALGVTSKNWIAGGQFAPFPRFDRVYPQPYVAFASSVNFARRVQSQFPFIVGTGNQVYLFSAISTP